MTNTFCESAIREAQSDAPEHSSRLGEDVAVIEQAATLMRLGYSDAESSLAIAQALEAIAKRATEAANAIWREQGQRIDAAATPGAQWGGTER